MDRSSWGFQLAWHGQIGYRRIFIKMAQYDYPGWAALERECCLKYPATGAAEGAPFIRDHIICVTDHAFDDFAGDGTDVEANRKIVGLLFCVRRQE